MLTQCYLGELYKRGSLPVPAQLLPRPEAIPGRPGAGGHFTGQEDGWSGADGHFPGQGGGWQGENRSGGGGQVSGGYGCTGRGTEEGGRAGSRQENDDSTRASNRGTGSRRQESEWAGADDLRRQEGGWAGAGGHFAGQGGGWQGENGGGGGGRVSGGPGCNGRGTEVDGRAGYEGNEREAIGNDARLDSGTAARIAKAARWLTGDHRPGLLLYGTVGSGKSTLARAIC